MPKVTHVKSAREDNPVCKKGEAYYWWKFRFGGKRYSLTPPKRSQLTQSNFLQSYYGLLEGLGDLFKDYEDWEDDRQTVLNAIEEMRDECQSSLDNMPEGLQSGPTGELLQERIDLLDVWLADIESCEIEDFEVEEVDCEECQGTGGVDEECEDCGGLGLDKGGDECPDCSAGFVSAECSACGGSGTVEGEEPSDEAKQEALDNLRADIEGTDPGIS